jgi:predicted hotdog family 3-hydroxylacyl-ACP dehydratase
MLHDAICARLPHAGRMCLLDRLVAWDSESITCHASSHRDADNPLRSGGRLHAVAGVEYAAQAVALHGSLLAAHDASTARDGGRFGLLSSRGITPTMEGRSAEREAVSEGGFIHWTNAGAVFRPPAIGYLASVRDLKLDLEDLGAVTEDLHITARRLSGDAGGFIYEFEIRAASEAVLSGRLAAKLFSTGVTR